MTNDLIKIYGEEYVNNYHSSPGKRYENIFKNIKLNQEDTALDIGCGNGLLYKITKNKIKKYTGVDFSKTFIEKCKNLYPENQESFHCENIINFCQKKENSFSKAFMLDFSEHVYDLELKEIFKSALKSLKEKGKLYLHTPNADYFLEKMKEKGIIKQTTGHVAVRNAKEYEALLKDSGFNSIRTTFLPHYNILSNTHFLSKLPIIGKYFNARLLIIASK